MALRLSCALCKVENAGKFNHIFDTILGHFIRMALDWSNDISSERNLGRNYKDILKKSRVWLYN